MNNCWQSINQSSPGGSQSCHWWRHSVPGLALWVQHGLAGAPPTANQGNTPPPPPLPTLSLCYNILTWYLDDSSTWPSWTSGWNISATSHPAIVSDVLVPLLESRSDSVYYVSFPSGILYNVHVTSMLCISLLKTVRSPHLLHLAWHFVPLVSYPHCKKVLSDL